MYAMSGKTFNPIETISNLLKRIDEGRKIFGEAKNLRDHYRNTCANLHEAGQFLDKSQREMGSLDERAKSEAKVEIDQRVSEYQKLNEEARLQLIQINKTVAFIEPINWDVQLLRTRLPVGSEWDAYRKAVGLLDIRDPGCWTDPPANPALDTLEMRLNEMLKLAVKRQVSTEMIAIPRSGENPAGRANIKPRRRNSAADRIFNQVMDLYKQATRENDMLTSAAICQRLDAKNILLPESTAWGRESKTWREAFGKHKGAVRTWLSRAKSASK